MSLQWIIEGFACQLIFIIWMSVLNRTLVQIRDELRKMNKKGE